MAFDLDTAYNWIVKACNASNVGYSQAYRNGQTVNGITYYDCASLIYYGLKAGGADLPIYNDALNPAFTTGQMVAANGLPGLGWKVVTDTNHIEPGDVGVINAASAQHTEMCYAGGSLSSSVWMGAHTDGVVLANQVSINTYNGPPHTWDVIYRYGQGGAVISNGPSIYVVAAMCGVWQTEGLNPGEWQSNVTGATWTDLNIGYGIGQWTNTDGDTHGRLYKLHEYVQSNGYSDGELAGQLAFLLYEQFWSPNYSSSYSSLNDFLKSDSTDIAQLARIFYHNWEGMASDNGTLSARISQAQDMYNYISEHADDTSISTPYSKNEYLTPDEQHANAVLIYRLLNGGTVPEQPKLYIVRFSAFP